MSPTRTTHNVVSLHEGHRAGVKHLVAGKLPGQWDDSDVDSALAEDESGCGFSIVAESHRGVVEGFMRFEVADVDGRVDRTTVKLIDFVSVNQAGLPMLRSLLERLHQLGFSQVVADTGEDMVPALESLGWTVFAPGFGLAWSESAGDVVGSTEPRTNPSRPLIAHLRVNDNLRVWPFRYGAKPDDAVSRSARIARWSDLTAGGTMLRSELTRQP